MVYQDLKNGGLGLVHFPSKLRFLLAKCVFSAVDSDMPFAYFVRYWGGDCHFVGSFPPCLVIVYPTAGGPRGHIVI